MKISEPILKKVVFFDWKLFFKRLQNFSTRPTAMIMVSGRSAWPSPVCQSKIRTVRHTNRSKRKEKQENQIFEKSTLKIKLKISEPTFKKVVFLTENFFQSSLEFYLRVLRQWSRYLGGPPDLALYASKTNQDRLTHQSKIIEENAKKNDFPNSHLYHCRSYSGLRG